MSMNDVIDQIAIAAEHDSRPSCLWLISKFDNLLLPEEKKQKDFSPERISELNQYARVRLPSPRLNIDTIDAILIDYPYKLPVELYELYQRGNGVLPIGKDRDWESYNNYFFFINGDSDWMPLDRAMKDYRNFCQHFYRSGYEVQPKLFPLVSFEECTWAIIGNEIQQATSPVFRFYDDERPEKIYFGNSELIVWNSLAEMFADDLSDAANWYRDKV